ncbi:MAG: penicillin-binding protein activator [Candidatus Marinimicrobia bacterium]|nr:penicillin-binding protein activator [Candidatus Neomarinimicrobiota bacterium]MCF7829816.1 penicillin-binding protein activator [Candidatus Neomarinimicrobiota bacterium]MCF7881751.1 penicillin-binding protein activator [Candidatus Neomarinimicrobiota bacterium]
MMKPGIDVTVLRRVTLIGIIGCIFLFDVPSASSQFFSKSETEKRFEAGVEAYNNQEYDQALQIFQNLYTLGDENPQATATHLMLVKTYHQNGLDRQSIKYGKEFIAAYSNSSYLDDIYFAMAQSYLAMSQYINGANYFGFSIVVSRDEALARIALDHLLKTTDIFLTMEEVQALADGAIESREKLLFHLALLQEYIQAGEMSLASTTAQELEEESLPEILKPTFQALRKAIQYEGGNQRLAIAVIAPLSGQQADIGEDLLRGIRFALSQSSVDRISIVPLDNAGTALETVRQLQRIVKHTRVVAVIGPMYSENVIAGAALAGKAQLPLISPTASGNGLAGLNKYIFQLSPDYETRGKAAAQYATDSLNLQTFATVSPADPQGKALTDAFTAEVEQRGGDVLEQVWYSGTPQDLGDQFTHLREVAFRLRDEYAATIDTAKIVSDSLRATMPDSEFVALFNERMAGKAEEIDSTEIKLKQYDGMYFPIRNSDIDYIAPQFALYNFDTQVIGNVDWYDEATLQQYSSYVDSMVVISDHYIPEGTQSYSDFVTDYRKMTNATPTTIDLYGYDAMQLLMQAIEDGNTTRLSLEESLESISRVQGQIRNYTLNGSRIRVNQSLNVLQYLRREFVPLDVITTGPRQVHPMELYFAE